MSLVGSISIKPTVAKATGQVNSTVKAFRKAQLEITYSHYLEYPVYLVLFDYTYSKVQTLSKGNEHALHTVL